MPAKGFDAGKRCKFAAATTDIPTFITSIGLKYALKQSYGINAWIISDKDVK